MLEIILEGDPPARQALPSAPGPVHRAHSRSTREPRQATTSPQTFSAVLLPTCWPQNLKSARWSGLSGKAPAHELRPPVVSAIRLLYRLLPLTCARSQE